MNRSEAITSAAWDEKEMLSRFMNNRQAIYSIMKMFEEDDTFDRLTQAVKTGNETEIESMAHMLKGVTAHLGFARMYQDSSSLVQAVRQGRREELKELFEELEEDYEAVLNAIPLITESV